MREHRIQVPPPVREGRVRLSEPAAHHLIRVLRLRPGDRVIAFDGEGGEAPAVLLAGDATGEWLAIASPQPTVAEPLVRLRLVTALLKGDKLSDVVRMGTELGVSRFSPLVSARCVVATLSAAKLVRLRRVAAEAARQSLRAHVPVIDEPVSLAALRWQGAAWIADPRASTAWGELAAARPAELTLISGPEGGFREAEVDALVARGAQSVRLVPSVLRAETAPIAMASAYLLSGGER